MDGSYTIRNSLKVCMRALLLLSVMISIASSLRQQSHNFNYRHQSRRTKIEPRLRMAKNWNNVDTKPARYLRINKLSDSEFELQTCVKRFRRVKDGACVDLHAQVHFGDEEYFRYFNLDNFNRHYDKVLYELIASNKLMQVDAKGCRRVVEDIGPSLSDMQTALQYGFKCQVDVVDYHQPKWYCADLSKEEFVALSNNENSQDLASFLGLKDPDLASTLSIDTIPGGEVMQALVRPTTPASQSGLETKLFSNLFLPGVSFAALLRALLWVVPVPELSVMLLDWSSLTPRGGGISPIAVPVLENIIKGNLNAARKLVFSQMVVSGQVNEDSAAAMISQRNDVALNELIKSIETEGCDRNAIVYGAHHCRDLQAKLIQMGFLSYSTEWRTAWRMNNAQTSSKASMKSESNKGWLGLSAVILYLLVSGLDWYASFIDVIQSSGDNLFKSSGPEAFETVSILSLYLARHVGLYFGLAKFVVEWDVSLFDGEKQ